MSKVGIIYNCYGILKFKILDSSTICNINKFYNTRLAKIQVTRLNELTSQCTIYDDSTNSVCTGRIIENKFLIKLISMLLKDSS